MFSGAQYKHRRDGKDSLKRIIGKNPQALHVNFEKLLLIKSGLLVAKRESSYMMIGWVSSHLTFAIYQAALWRSLESSMVPLSHYKQLVTSGNLSLGPIH